MMKLVINGSKDNVYTFLSMPGTIKTLIKGAKKYGQMKANLYPFKVVEANYEQDGSIRMDIEK